MKKDLVYFNGKWGVWRTIGGKKIFIEDGYELEQAMYDNGSFNEIIRKNKQLKPVKVGKQEYAIFMSEVNTYYEKNETRPYLCKAVGNYLYFFKNNGFNNYVIIKRQKIGEEKTKVFEKRSENE